MQLRAARCQRSNQSGAAAVEFALVMIPFIALLLGTLQFAWYFFAAQSANAAAREGARRVVVGECWDDAAFKAYVKDQSPMITESKYTPTDLTTASVGDVITVSVEAEAGIINFIPLGNGGKVQREFQARLEDTLPGDGTCS